LDTPLGESMRACYCTSGCSARAGGGREWGGGEGGGRTECQKADETGQAWRVGGARAEEVGGGGEGGGVLEGHVVLFARGTHASCLQRSRCVVNTAEVICCQLFFFPTGNLCCHLFFFPAGNLFVSFPPLLGLLSSFVRPCFLLCWDSFPVVLALFFSLIRALLTIVRKSGSFRTRLGRPAPTGSSLSGGWGGRGGRLVMWGRAGDGGTNLQKSLCCVGFLWVYARR
jgi:hypothetical protein